MRQANGGLLGWFRLWLCSSRCGFLGLRATSVPEHPDSGFVKHCLNTSGVRAAVPQVAGTRAAKGSVSRSVKVIFTQ